MPEPTKKLRGQAVTMADGETYQMPPLCFALLEEHGALIGQLKAPPFGVFEKADREVHVTLYLASFQRNYPDMTREQLIELLDLESAGECYLAFMAANALRELLRPGGASP